VKYFLDTEFVEDGKTIDLISIGIVSETGAQYYAVNRQCDWAAAHAHPFVSQNVIPFLPADTGEVNSQWRAKSEIAREVLAFVGDDDSIEFWGDYCSYDWVALCQLFGTMMDLPKGWPMFCHDVQVYASILGVVEFPPYKNWRPHDALFDAVETRARHEYLAKVAKGERAA